MRNFIKIGFVICFMLSCAFNLSANTLKNDTGLIEFSGLVLTSDSLYPISYAYVYHKYTRAGDVTDINGFFAITAKRGDTIIFNCQEFQKVEYVIPDSLKESKYNIIKLLTQDTHYLQPLVLYPLPPRKQFDQIFVRNDVPDDDLEIARKNLKRENLRQEALEGRPDAKAAYSQEMRKQAENLYWKGQLPPNNLLNPMAWQSFFKAWQRGDYKKKKKAKKKIKK